MPTIQIFLVVLGLTFMGCTKAVEYAQQKREESNQKVAESNEKIKQLGQRAEMISKYTDCVARAETAEAIKKCQELNPDAAADAKKSKSERDQADWDQFSGEKADIQEKK